GGGVGGCQGGPGGPRPGDTRRDGRSPQRRRRAHRESNQAAEPDRSRERRPDRMTPAGGPPQKKREDPSMSISCKFERSLLNHEEYDVIRSSHHPEIYELDRAGLQALQGRLRQMRDKERTLTRQRRRDRRGKAAPRGGTFPGPPKHPLQRKQVSANPLNRGNREAPRTRKLKARAANIDAARRALALRRAANFPAY